MNLREIVLKETPRRRVHLELEDDRPVRVVKRIPAAGLAGLRARRLAKREFEVQRKLFVLGLAVPEPLLFSTTAEGVEFVQRCVAGARELADVLRAEAEPGRERLARAVGTLIGRAHALGLDHPDLHEKNVLVDADGEPWLIDFHGARIAREADAERARRDLVLLAAATRERASVRERQRAFLAWWSATDARALPAEAPSVAAAAIELAARGRRRSVLARQTKRWERPSSSARAFEIGGSQRGMARAELDGARLEALLRAAWRAPRFECEHALAEFDDGAQVLVLHGQEPARIAAAFLASARLADHALSAARPVLHLKAPEPGALFAVPRGARPLDALLRAGGVDRRAVARAVGALFGALEDRGLAVDLKGRAPWIESRPRGFRAWLTPPFTLAERPLDRSGAPWNAALMVLGDVHVEERRACLAAWLAEQRSGAAVERELRARIAAEHGPLGAGSDG